MIVFILAFWMLGLSCLPCADAFAAGHDEIKTEMLKSDDQQEHNDHEDACSPFCHCACCANYSMSNPQSFIAALPSFDNKSYTSYLSDNIIEVSLPVWQPPKIG